jgi:serine/threonine protein phosphatase PrpC
LYIIEARNAMKDTTFRRPIAWKSCALTDVGTVRAANEDAVLMRPDMCLWAVADGMGGHEVGDVASRKIIEALMEVEDKTLLSDFIDHVEDTLLEANQDILDFSKHFLGQVTMGSTVVVLLIRGKIGVCLWAGDSRLYRFRNHQLEQLSRDHSQVEEMLQAGELTPEQAKDYPHSNVITRALGAEENVFIEATVFDTQIGDTFLLCSDGLYNALDDDAIVSALKIRDVEESAELLIQEALHNSARDNVSVVVIQGESGKLTSTSVDGM